MTTRHSDAPEKAVTPLRGYDRTMIATKQGVAVDFPAYGEGLDVAIDGVWIVCVPRFAWLGNVKVGPSIPKLFLDRLVVLWTMGLLRRRCYDFMHAHEGAMLDGWMRYRA